MNDRFTLTADEQKRIDNIEKARNDGIEEAILKYSKYNDRVHAVLKKFIEETRQRLNRVYDLAGENYMSSFYAELAYVVLRTDSKSATAKAVSEIRQGKQVPCSQVFRTNLALFDFKRQSIGAKEIDYADFMKYMIAEIPSLAPNSAFVKAEKIDYLQQAVETRKCDLHYMKSDRIKAKQYIDETWKALNFKIKQMGLTTDETLKVQSEFIKKLKSTPFEENSHNRKLNYNFRPSVINNDQSEDLDVIYKNFKNKINAKINKEVNEEIIKRDAGKIKSNGLSSGKSRPNYYGIERKEIKPDVIELDSEMFISAALNLLTLSERKENLIKAVADIKTSVTKDYTNKNKADIVTFFNTRINELETEISKPETDFYAASKQSKDTVIKTISDMRAREEAYYNNISFFKGYKQSNSSLQPRIAKANKIFAADVLSLLSQDERINSIMTEIESVIKSYSGTSKTSIVNDFNDQMAELKKQMADPAFKMDNLKLLADEEVVEKVKNSITKILSSIQHRETAYYNSEPLLFGCKSNSSLQPKINEAKDILDCITIGAHRAPPAKR